MSYISNADLMGDKIPAWITPGVTVFAWLPQMPHRYIRQPTRWQCKVLSVQRSQSRRRPASVILSVPEEVYMNKSFSQYYPDFDGYVRHVDDQQKSIMALPLKLYRNDKLQLEQTQPPPALSQSVSSPSPTTNTTQNMSAASVSQPEETVSADVNSQSCVCVCVVLCCHVTWRVL